MPPLQSSSRRLSKPQKVWLLVDREQAVVQLLLLSLLRLPVLQLVLLWPRRLRSVLLSRVPVAATTAEAGMAVVAVVAAGLGTEVAAWLAVVAAAAWCLS